MELEGHKDCIYGLSQGPENHFFTGGADGWVVDWELTGEKQGKLIATLPTAIYSLYYIKTQNLLVAGLANSGYILLDLKKKEIKRIFKKALSIFDFTIYNNQLIVAGEKGYIFFLDLETLDEQSFKIDDNNIRKIELRKNLLTAATSSGKIKVFNVEKKVIEKELKAHDKAIFSFTYFTNGEKLVTGSMDAQLKIWQSTDGNFELFLKIPAHFFTLNDITVLENKNLFATASRDKTIKIWDLSTFEIQKVIDYKYNGHKHSVNRLLFLDGHLISISDDKKIMVWEII